MAGETTTTERAPAAKEAPKAQEGQGATSSATRTALRGMPYEAQVAALTPVQMRGEGGGADVQSAAAAGVKGGGGALPHQASIQKAFGRHDVGNVQAHVGGAAAQASAAMGAEAYATGNHVAFRDAPSLHTAAHEAAHVVQQRAGVQLSGGVGKAGDRYEQHADAVADAVVSGRSAEPLLDSATGGKAVQKKESAAVQLKPTEVKNKIKDGPYGWTSSYDVDFTEKECLIVIRVKLSPADSTVTAKDIEKTQADAASSFKKLWDNKFKITDKSTGKVYALRLSLTFTSDKPHITATLKPGTGRANLSTWYVTPKSRITMAHELGHQLGLKDEYVDSRVPERKDDKASGVHKDHSLMGNYYAEGVDKAEVKERHADTIASHIGAATGRTLDASAKD